MERVAIGETRFHGRDHVANATGQRVDDLGVGHLAGDLALAPLFVESSDAGHLRAGGAEVLAISVFGDASMDIAESFLVAATAVLGVDSTPI
jgi:hypothetical protein